ncbi:MAG TPA: hypothetical protein VFR78_04805 [Pyrinomonadaceae bacterium]|nr:hypothetical protein [Pyrinomonadaceae bacterium]
MPLRKIFIATLFLALTATVANAYTIVMRDGRKLEIPNKFTVTNTTLTYETAPGFQVTIQLATVDIAATERANGQPAGNFMVAGAKPQAPAPVQTQRLTATRSITNKDLETYKRARLESERERAELGLPSLEDRRREVEEIDERTQEHIKDLRSREELDFWRNRAMTLETQMATTQNETNVNPFSGYWSYPIDGGVVPIGDFHRFDRFGILNRFDRFGLHKFGFSRFGFNNPEFKQHFPINFGRARAIHFRSGDGHRGGSHRGGSHRGGGHRGGSRGGRR